MIISKRSIVFFVLAILAVFHVSANYRLVLQSGHEGSPTDVEWHAKTGNILSVGEDGRFIVTDPDDGKVLHRFRIGNERIHQVAGDPSSDKAAVVSSDKGQYSVSVWDWGDEEKIFDYDLDSEPLFVVWSARGRYLTIGNLGDPSIIVLEGRTGRRLSYLQRLPSLYNAGYIGSTETILMTYASSGAIRYWDIRSSALKLSAETVTNLTDPVVLQIEDKSTLFARRFDTLYLINRQTGAVLEQMEISGLMDVSVDPEDGSVDVLVSTPRGAEVQQYLVRDGNLVERSFGGSTLAVDAALSPVRILRGDGNTYLATEDGRFLESHFSGFSPVVDDNIWRPDALAFDDGALYMSGENRVFRFSSPFFETESEGDISELNDLSLDIVDLPSTSEETGIEILSGGDVLTWDKNAGGLGTGIRIFDFDRPADVDLIQSSGALTKVQVIDPFRLLTIDRNGKVSIIDSKNGEALTEYTALGILDAAYSAAGDSIIAGRSNNGQAGTPLESIDVRTRESVPVPDERFMVYRIVADDDATYSIGVTRGSGNAAFTTLLSHDDENPGRTRVLDRYTGEDLDAVVIPRESGSGVYTTLGGEVKKIVGTRKTRFRWGEPVTEIQEHGGYLYGLDGNGALVLWDARSAKALFRVYFFTDGSWIALIEDSDQFKASPGAIDNVIFYRNGRPVDPRRISGLQIAEPSAPLS